MSNVFRHGLETKTFDLSLGKRNWWFNSQKLEDLKGDKLFHTLAQEMESSITNTKPDENFITEKF